MLVFSEVLLNIKTYEEITPWCNLIVGLECISQSLETIVAVHALFCNGCICHPYRQHTILL